MQNLNNSLEEEGKYMSLASHSTVGLLTELNYTPEEKILFPEYCA